MFKLTRPTAAGEWERRQAVQPPWQPPWPSRVTVLLPQLTLFRGHHCWPVAVGVVSTLNVSVGFGVSVPPPSASISLPVVLQLQCQRCSAAWRRSFFLVVCCKLARLSPAKSFKQTVMCVCIASTLTQLVDSCPVRASYVSSQECDVRTSVPNDLHFSTI